MTIEQIRRQIDDPHLRLVFGEMWVRSQWDTFKTIFFFGDTVTVRALLMVASVLQAVGFLLPLQTLDRPYFADMRFLPAWIWGSLYLAHAFAQWWRFRSGPNVWAGFVVNLYGFVLWTFTTLLGTLSIRTYSPATALEWTVVAALFAAICRTGDPADRASA